MSDTGWNPAGCQRSALTKCLASSNKAGADSQCYAGSKPGAQCGLTAWRLLATRSGGSHTRPPNTGSTADSFV